MSGAIERIDWKLLRKQKLALVEVISGKSVTKKRIELLGGILHLIDGIQDDATEVLSEETVFGKNNS